MLGCLEGGFAGFIWESAETCNTCDVLSSGLRGLDRLGLVKILWLTGLAATEEVDSLGRHCFQNERWHEDSDTGFLSS